MACDDSVPCGAPSSDSGAQFLPWVGPCNTAVSTNTSVWGTAELGSGAEADQDASGSFWKPWLIEGTG